MNSNNFRFVILLLSWLLTATTVGWTQVVPRGWLTPLAGSGNNFFVDPADLLAVLLRCKEVQPWASAWSRNPIRGVSMLSS